MKLLRLKIDNFRGIEAREIVPDGKHVHLHGPNGVGKSSVALGFLHGLTGKGSTQPVRDGADASRIEFQIGDFVFTRTNHADGKPSKFEGRGIAGKKLPATPAEFIRQVIGTGLALNPLALFTMADEEQQDAILAALKVDVLQEETQTAMAFDERTEVNRRKKAAEARVIELEAKGAKRDAEPAKSLDAVKQRLAAARTRYQSELKLSEECLLAREAHEAAQRAYEAATEALAKAEARITAAAEARAKVPPGGEEELKAAEQELEGLSKQREDAALGAELRDRLKQAEEERKAADALTAKLEALSKQRASKIESAAKAVGLDGLRFSEGKRGLNLNGVRLAELNAAAQLDVGMRIGLAGDPALRVAIIDDASRFDAAGLRRLLEWGSERDVQVVFATVDREGEGLKIELVDGPDEKLA